MTKAAIRPVTTCHSAPSSLQSFRRSAGISERWMRRKLALLRVLHNFLFTQTKVSGFCNNDMIEKFDA